MIEVPSAAITSDILAREVDFFSIGTNDLIQYALPSTGSMNMCPTFLEPASPAILRIIQRGGAGAEQHGIPVAICGEMAAEPKYVDDPAGTGVARIQHEPAAIRR